jgi:pyruvate, water dikinase
MTAMILLIMTIGTQLNGKEYAMNYIRWFEDVQITDIPEVGGKNASLGQMIRDLSSQGILVPMGFAITAQAYWDYIDYNKLRDTIKNLAAQLTDPQDIKMIDTIGQQIRDLIDGGKVPPELDTQIRQAYRTLSKRYNQDACDVAIRSSATAEDLPNASFAGQQETFLNVHGADRVIELYKKALASLFTNRAIAYRMEQGFDHFQVALSVGVQKMIRSDLASSGVAFSLDTDSGFADVVLINASYGLGEFIVQGVVTPDEFIVHKPTLLEGFKSIIKKQLGDKKIKMVYGTDPGDMPTKTVDVSLADYFRFSLTDEEILTLARAVCIIEKLYSTIKGSWAPMDVEWAKDGIDGKIYIVQARPETVHAREQHQVLILFKLKDINAAQLAQKTVTTGQSIGQRIVHGIARVVADITEVGRIQKGDIIVTHMTDPDWVSAMKRAVGIVTEQGGRTCHAAIVSRELNIPAVIGTHNAMEVIKDGQAITIDCSRGAVGYVYDGQIPFETTDIVLDKIPKMPIDIMVNLADPASAFEVSKLPVQGVGLARLEFIITNAIKVHPMALIHPEKVTDQARREMINQITASYEDKKEFFIDQLACHIGMIAAAFYPRTVIVRFSDFKSNEYRNLIGGSYFEPEEENPMIGFRGASRYYDERYKEAFALECAALKKVRDEMGLVNVEAMIPFVRTTQEAQKVLDEMARNGLVRGQNDLRVIMMCEIPSNVLLVDNFSKLFDGFSIGSNDLTQMTLGVDRDSALLAASFDERDPAVKKLMTMAIEGALRNHVYIGICGQGPSDYPELAEFLIKQGIESISLNPDTVLPFMMRYK